VGVRGEREIKRETLRRVYEEALGLRGKGVSEGESTGDKQRCWRMYEEAPGFHPAPRGRGHTREGERGTGASASASAQRVQGAPAPGLRPAPADVDREQVCLVLDKVPGQSIVPRGRRSRVND